MEKDPTRRFSSRVEDYVRYRPGYPAGILELLAREFGLKPGDTVADIGSGTGLFSELFLRYGCEVFGVEPNRDMRVAGERLLAGYPKFHSIEGRGEETGLPTRIADLVAAGQSFHWLDQDRAREEFRRISKPPHNVALVWNERLVEGGFLERYEALLERYSTDYAQVDHRRVGAAAMDRLFGPGAWRVASFSNEQQFDLAGLLGRLHSSSYAPQPDSPDYDRINADMERLFAECQVDGRVAFRYETKVYYGALRGSLPASA